MILRGGIDRPNRDTFPESPLDSRRCVGCFSKVNLPDAGNVLIDGICWRALFSQLADRALEQSDLIKAGKENDP